jgi:hypothetical protein
MRPRHHDGVSTDTHSRGGPRGASGSTYNRRYGPPRPLRTCADSENLARDNQGVLIRSVDTLPGACLGMRALPRAGIDLDHMSPTLERQGLASFPASLNRVLGALDAKTHVHTAR